MLLGACVRLACQAVLTGCCNVQHTNTPRQAACGPGVFFMMRVEGWVCLGGKDGDSCWSNQRPSLWLIDGKPTIQLPRGARANPDTMCPSLALFHKE